MTIFYGWVSHNEPERDPCRCGSARCRGTINFDVSDEDAAHASLGMDGALVMDDALRARVDAYAAFLRSIGQEQVREAIVATLTRMKLRPAGSKVCAF